MGGTLNTQNSKISNQTYLLDTIKIFSDHENRSLEPKQKNLEKPLWGGYPYEPEFQNSEYAGHQVGANEAGSQNFSCLGFMV
jgi:hypothetical protein